LALGNEIDLARLNLTGSGQKNTATEIVDMNKLQPSPRVADQGADSVVYGSEYVEYLTITGAVYARWPHDHYRQARDEFESRALTVKFRSTIGGQRLGWVTL
jgi:hypothetical protein